jgi:hypothetical protein
MTFCNRKNENFPVDVGFGEKCSSHGALCDSSLCLHESWQWLNHLNFYETIFSHQLLLVVDSHRTWLFCVSCCECAVTGFHQGRQDS